MFRPDRQARHRAWPWLILGAAASLAACQGPVPERVAVSGAPVQGPSELVEVPVAGPEFAQAAAAALENWARTNPDSPGLRGSACVGYVAPAAGPPELHQDWRQFYSFPDPLFRELAAERPLWSPAALCEGGPGLAATARVPQGGQPRLVYCEGITKVPAGWRLFCGWKGPGPVGSRPEYVVSPTDRPGRFQVARTCPACQKTG